MNRLRLTELRRLFNTVSVSSVNCRLFYNPPINAAATINLGKEFLKIIDQHFPKSKKHKDKLEKCINRHNIKISYSRTKSVAKIISSHNAKILREHKKCTTGNRENVAEAVEEEDEVSTNELEEREWGRGVLPIQME